MSRGSKRPDFKSDPAKSGKAARRQPARRAPAPLPEVMLARRPMGAVAASRLAEPTPERRAPAPSVEPPTVALKRPVRIVAAPVADENELERRQLLARLLESEGPAAVTRAANAYRKGGFQFPEEQIVQLKLLEHRDEAEVSAALSVLAGLLDVQSPIQLPVFEQRLKRLEDSAEEVEIRVRAAELRRVLRT